MEDWAKRLDGFLEFNGNEILTDAGKNSAKQAKLYAETEYEKYQIVHDRIDVYKRQVNAAVNIYEIELSDMLDFYENLLMKSKEFIEEFEKVDIINDDKSYYWKFLPQAKVLIDMVATFSEEVSELKRKMLNGKLNKYWKKDIYKEEKKNRINYHK